MPRALRGLPARDVITATYATLATLSLVVPAVHDVLFEFLWSSGMVLMGVALTCLVGVLMWCILKPESVETYEESAPEPEATPAPTSVHAPVPVPEALTRPAAA
ncbi:hypothetical protein [Deinococcus pimensis]|uniref:hypothetical protein n=1 Tax=Deinococcus pimensis TaxID=309888 RepID=UPI00048870BE|nr:hypothetical protein [Deinococcus pimensis]